MELGLKDGSDSKTDRRGNRKQERGKEGIPGIVAPGEG